MVHFYYALPETVEAAGQAVVRIRLDPKERKKQRDGFVSEPSLFQRSPCDASFDSARAQI